MAVTITIDKRINAGSAQMIAANIALDNSYATGGYAVTPGQFGLSRIDEIWGMDSGGLTPEYIASTGKIKVYTGIGGSAAFTGLALATHAHSNLSIEKELVTVTTNAGILAAIPVSITMIYANTATSVGPKIIIPDGVAPAAGQVAVNFATGGLVFNATDAVTQATVTYEPEVAGAGGGKGIQAITAGTPAGTIALTGGAAGEVTAATDLSAITLMKLIVIGA